MAGIRDISVYLPLYRVERRSIAGAWGKELAGVRPVANFDEDAITMASAALSRLDFKGRSINMLYFASPQMPYRGMLNAGILAQVLGLPPDAVAEDGSTCGRGATLALRDAARALKSGETAGALVVTAEVPRARPGSEEEQDAADAAAAVDLDRGPGMAELIGTASCRSDLLEKWLPGGREFSSSSDARFAARYGFEQPCVEAVQAVLRQAGISPEDVQWAAVAAPNLRQYRAVLKKLALRPQVSLEQVYTGIGSCGAAMPLLLLYQALRQAAPGDVILVGGFSGGVDALLFRVTGDVLGFQAGKSFLEPETNMLIDYVELLKRKRIIPMEELAPEASPVLSWREREDILHLSGQRCTVCSAIQFPRRRICWKCRAKDSFVDFPLERSGRVYTFTADYLYPNPFGATIMAVIDVTGGGRLYTQMTDCSRDDVHIGVPVELCLRRLHQGGEFNNYFWKARPLSEPGGEKE